MKNTGIVRKLDNLNRITLSMELHTSLGLKKNQPMEIWIEGDRVILTAYKSISACSHCGSADNVTIVGTSSICNRCIATAVGRME